MKPYPLQGIVALKAGPNKLARIGLTQNLGNQYRWKVSKFETLVFTRSAL